jgi:hypothetical protein
MQSRLLWKIGRTSKRRQRSNPLEAVDLVLSIEPRLHFSLSWYPFFTEVDISLFLFSSFRTAVLSYFIHCIENIAHFVLFIWLQVFVRNISRARIRFDQILQ